MVWEGPSYGPPEPSGQPPPYGQQPPSGGYGPPQQPQGGERGRPGCLWLGIVAIALALIAITIVVIWVST